MSVKSKDGMHAGLDQSKVNNKQFINQLLKTPVIYV